MPRSIKQMLQSYLYSRKLSKQTKDSPKQWKVYWDNARRNPQFYLLSILVNLSIQPRFGLVLSIGISSVIEYKLEPSSVERPQVVCSPLNLKGHQKNILYIHLHCTIAYCCWELGLVLLIHVLLLQNYLIVDVCKLQSIRGVYNEGGWEGCTDSRESYHIIKVAI
jgi:hypothetical protein